jgi:hypothetical protein
MTGHHNEDVRVTVVGLFLQLGGVFDASLTIAKKGREVLTKITAEPGTLNCAPYRHTYMSGSDND